jgi:hypothetical protein
MPFIFTERHTTHYPKNRFEAHIALMQVYITEQFSGLVCNLGEVGSLDWEDRKSRNMIAPLMVSVGDMFHPVSRGYRHETFFMSPRPVTL